MSANRFAQTKLALEGNESKIEKETALPNDKPLLNSASEKNDFSAESQPATAEPENDRDSAKSSKTKKEKKVGLNSSVPPVRKSLLLPIEYELSVKELKARRNFARQFTKEKGLITEEDIILEALELLFTQPGIYSECMDFAKDRMKLLIPQEEAF